MLTGTISAAARLLHVSQPGVSRMISVVEARVGLTLFERIRGRLRPTPEAEALYAQVQRVYGEIERVGSLADDLREGGRQVLRVACSPSLMLEVVPSVIVALTQRHPQARFHLETLTTAEMVRQLARREVDVAVSSNPTADASIASQPIGAWSLVCAFSPPHRFDSMGQVALRDLVAESVVSFPADTPQGQFVAQWCTQHGHSIKSAIQVRSGMNACAIVRRGGGVAVVDEWTARAFGPQGLAFRPIPGAPEVSIVSLSNPGVPQSMVARVFVEALGQELERARGARDDRLRPY